jgi:hypothetical protein
VKGRVTVRAIPIDNFFEDLDEQRRTGAPVSPGAFEWARLVADGRAARTAADGGRWRIGALATAVERRYASGALQRFASEIGESYASVRRYRWVTKAYDENARARFSTLSFSHFQAVAGLPDKLIWLARAERGSWSVDRLARESHAEPAARSNAEIPLDRLRSSIDGVRRLIAPAALADDASLADAGKAWLAEALDELSEEIGRLRERVTRATRNAAAGRSAKVARIRKTASKPRRREPATEASPSRATALKARAVGR